MLAFVDLPKGIRFIRVDHDGDIVTRTPLGRVSKATLEIDDLLSSKFETGEREEAEAIISGYLEAELFERRSYALRLPIILRQVLEYLEGDATEVERKFIMGAILEALRRMRKFEREEHQG